MYDRRTANAHPCRPRAVTERALFRKEHGKFFTSILHDPGNKLHIFPL